MCGTLGRSCTVRCVMMFNIYMQGNALHGFSWRGLKPPLCDERKKWRERAADGRLEWGQRSVEAGGR